MKLCCLLTAAPRLLIFSSLDGTSSVRLKSCCTTVPRLLIFSSLDGSSCVRLKLCCSAVPRLLIFCSLDGASSVRLKLCCTAVPRPPLFSFVDGSSCVCLKFRCTQARNQAGALSAIAPSIAPPSHCTLWRFALHIMYLGHRSSPSLLPCIVDFIANYFTPYGILAWLRACGQLTSVSGAGGVRLCGHV